MNAVGELSRFSVGHLIDRISIEVGCNFVVVCWTNYKREPAMHFLAAGKYRFQLL